MAYSKNALSLLRNYESDSDKDSGYTSEEEKKRKANFLRGQEKKKKFKHEDVEDDMMDCNESTLEISSANRTVDHPALASAPPRIPLPDELTVSASETVDNPLLHERRIRSFPHERGNWASLLFVPLVFGIYEPHLKSMISVLIRTCEESQLEFSSSSEFHISLSRTLILRLHWIQPLLDDLRKKLSGFTKFSMWLHGLAVYSNEEKTRTFLGVKVHQGRNEMLEIVNFINDALEEYQLPIFYEDCSFHVSLGWCLGDKKEEFSKLLPQLEGICNHYFDIESDMRTFEVDELFFKTGNRIHRIALKVK